MEFYSIFKAQHMHEYKLRKFDRPAAHHKGPERTIQTASACWDGEFERLLIFTTAYVQEDFAQPEWSCFSQRVERADNLSHAHGATLHAAPTFSRSWRRVHT